jgi:hypothetical protein
MFRYRHESKLKYLARWLWVEMHPYLVVAAFCLIVARLIVVKL